MKKILYKSNQQHPQIKEYKKAIEKGKLSHHVLLRGSGWVVKRADSVNVEQVFGTQTQATQYAESLAKNQGTAVFIHSSDGRIKERRDY